ncbi:hypothetical protein J2Z42_002278 [Clostridium algifaecis]|uniref:Holin-like toxin n=1 Tax=Clostridium algifaecis TaxID=1472040 RepID=A0ABS4KVE5_9CLOT|nr:hypothetical protein [Clostridium algifaecis]
MYDLVMAIFAAASFLVILINLIIVLIKEIKK